VFADQLENAVTRKGQELLLSNKVIWGSRNMAAIASAFTTSGHFFCRTSSSIARYMPPQVYLSVCLFITLVSYTAEHDASFVAFEGYL